MPIQEGKNELEIKNSYRIAAATRIDGLYRGGWLQQ